MGTAAWFGLRTQPDQWALDNRQNKGKQGKQNVFRSDNFALSYTEDVSQSGVVPYLLRAGVAYQVEAQENEKGAVQYVESPLA